MYDELIDELRHYFADVPLVLQAADALEELQKRVPKSPHGRLIDADELFKEMERKGWFDAADRDKAEDLVLDAPTIIPAEEGE